MWNLKNKYYLISNTYFYYMLVLIAPFSKSFDDIWLTYFVPQDLEKYIKLWLIVDIPLQSQIVPGIILDILEHSDIEQDKLKSIISIKYETPLLYNFQINLLKWIAKYYFANIHSTTNLFFPKNLKEKIEKLKFDIISKKELTYTFNYSKDLTQSQQDALKKIEISKKNILFYWVTWAWKTEVYINLVKKNIDLWKQSLILVPEIILTNQIFYRFQEIFWKDVIIINSSISEATKTKNWIDIYNNNAKIIIWTRSALFYPYSNLWLIIIDEEHDLSYKSETSPRIDAREVAIEISKYTDSKLILASGTPCIKNMYKAIKWEFEIVNLLKEYNPK